MKKHPHEEGWSIGGLIPGTKYVIKNPIPGLMRISGYGALGGITAIRTEIAGFEIERETNSYAGKADNAIKEVIANTYNFLKKKISNNQELNPKEARLWNELEGIIEEVD